MKKFKYMVLAVLLSVGGIALLSLGFCAVFQVALSLPDWLVSSGLVLVAAVGVIGTIQNIYFVLKDKYMK